MQNAKKLLSSRVGSEVDKGMCVMCAPRQRQLLGSVSKASVRASKQAMTTKVRAFHLGHSITVVRRTSTDAVTRLKCIQMILFLLPLSCSNYKQGGCPAPREPPSQPPHDLEPADARDVSSGGRDGHELLQRLLHASALRLSTRAGQTRRMRRLKASWAEALKPVRTFKGWRRSLISWLPRCAMIF